MQQFVFKDLTFNNDKTKKFLRSENMECTTNVIEIITIIFLYFTVLVLVFVVYNRRRESHIKYPGPDDDVRENIINYDDEGGGEDDMTAFDITPLQIPVNGPIPEMGGKLPPCKIPCTLLRYLIVKMVHDIVGVIYR